MNPSSSRARVHIQINLVLQILLFVLHLLVGVSTLVGVVLYFYGLGPYAVDASNQGRQFGNLLTLIALGGWSLMGMVWTPLNAYGLWKRRIWARGSTSAYWLLFLATLCGLPFSVYGLWSLGRGEVRDALQSSEEP